MAKGGKSMLEGMKTMTPKDSDKSMTCGNFVGRKAGSVNSDSTRGGTAPTPKSLGPRVA
jgi:hypothetical protein